MELDVLGGSPSRHHGIELVVHANSRNDLVAGTILTDRLGHYGRGWNGGSLHVYVDFQTAC